MGLFGRLFGGGKMPGADKKNHFYLRDAVREGLNQPIHIHFDSYEPFIKMGNKILPNPCTFMVTLSSLGLSPRGLTCKVSGTNHKFRHHGVLDGVIAHVSMIRHDEDDSIERVYVQLLEDSRVVGQRFVDGKLEELTNLDGVYFMPGDTVFLNGMGEPYDSDNQPRPTKEQQLFLEWERKQMTDSILNRGAEQ
jgi:hypothetical protein